MKTNKNCPKFYLNNVDNATAATAAAAGGGGGAEGSTPSNLPEPGTPSGDLNI